MNLATNGVKFSPDNSSITITCKYVKHTIRNKAVFGKIQISVTDQGVGIKKEDQAKLFTLFGFIDTTKEMNTQGVGLGLHICQKIARHFGGQVVCESEYGQGATFTFRFQLSDPAEAKDPNLVPRCKNPLERVYPKFPLVGPGAKRILVADDQLFNVNALCHLLEVAGPAGIKAAVDKAADGVQAVERAREALEGGGPAYGLVFMDCAMPEMSGYEATEAIRELHREHGAAQPMVVAQTGHCEASFVEKAFRYGMDEVLPKPLNDKVVRQILAEALEQ
mmetsp:Transcript_3940/g.6681  ORF Transcript_3940/g.6681 Transcript_3940/m.6681 type:complete len:278 (-) Transcript_3940:48-881(-)